MSSDASDSSLSLQDPKSKKHGATGNHQTIILIVTAVALFLSTAIFAALPDSLAMFIDRVVSAVAALPLIYFTIFQYLIMQKSDSLWIQCLHFDCFKNAIDRQRSFQAAHDFHLTSSVKYFLLLMIATSISGYTFRLCIIYMLQNFDFALTYTWKEWMIIFDVIYCIVIIIFLITQLRYIWFYYEKLGFFETSKFHKTLYGISILLNIWQKWLFETLIRKEENCDHLSEELNSTCQGQRHYHSNMTWLSEAEKQALYLHQIFSPLSYSTTMEIFSVFLVILCYPQLHHSLQKFIGPLQKFQVKWKFGLKLIVCFVLLCSIACLLLKIVVMFHDKNQQRIDEQWWYNIFKLGNGPIVFLSFMLYTFLYKDINSDDDTDKMGIGKNAMTTFDSSQHGSQNSLIPDDESLTRHLGILTKKRPKKSLFRILWHSLKEVFVLKNREPDMIIFQISYFATIFTILLNWIVQLIEAVNQATKNEFDFEWSRLWKKLAFSVGFNVVSMSATALNFDLLHKFLTANSEMLQQISNDSFTMYWMAPFQISRSFIRAITRFVEVLDPEVFYVKSHTLDEWLTMIEATYPFSLIIHVTTALCWAHVLEKLFVMNN